jgi:phosphoglycolate phosphatase-like HAD superfamily hydrolase
MNLLLLIAEILQRLFSERRMRPEKVLMVGDALTDWEGAKRAGTAFIGIQTGMSSSISSDIILLRNQTLFKKHLFQDLV